VLFGTFDTFALLGDATPIVPTLGGGGPIVNHILTEGSNFIDTESGNRLITES